MIITGLCIWYYLGRIVPTIRTIIEETVRIQVSKAIDDMTDSELRNITYEDIIITRFDGEGHVTLMQVNSVNVDVFARKVTARIREEMEAFREEGISINLGTMSGIPFLSGMGPSINFNALNLGIVDADFISEFTSGGINQTLHRLYMRIVVNMTVTLPGRTYEFDNGSSVMICEAVIAGNIPNAVVSLGDMTTGDLLP